MKARVLLVLVVVLAATLGTTHAMATLGRRQCRYYGGGLQAQMQFDAGQINGPSDWIDQIVFMIPSLNSDGKKVVVCSWYPGPQP